MVVVWVAVMMVVVVTVVVWEVGRAAGVRASVVTEVVGLEAAQTAESKVVVELGVVAMVRAVMGAVVAA